MKARSAGKSCHVELSPTVDSEFENSETPHVVLVDHLVRAIHQFHARRTEFDVLFIYIPKRWERGFVGKEGEDFDLHDHLKAAAAGRRLPIQLVREDKALAYPDRASVAWRAGLALYARQAVSHGNSLVRPGDRAPSEYPMPCVQHASNQPRFVTCCSQVFDSEGAGLEFIAYDAHDVEVQRDNPFLSPKCTPVTCSRS